MNDQLSQVERDVILESVEKSGSPWIIQAKGSADRIFIPQGKATIHAHTILFVPSTVISPDVFAPILGIDAAVFFFYGGRGMFFSSKAQRTAQGTAFVISPAIYKQTDTAPASTGHLSGKLYYGGLQNPASVITCESSQGYPLFTPYTWLNFPRETAKAARDLLFQVTDLEPVEFKQHSPAREAMELSKRMLYLPEHHLPERNFFPYEASVTKDDVFASELSLLYGDASDHHSECFIPLADSPDHEVHTICALKSDSPVVSPFEILRTTMLIPAVRYLAETSEPVESVLGRQHPYHILYITESKIVLGSQQQDSILVYGAEFPIALYAECGLIQREITATVKISQRYDEGSRYAVVGNLLNIKEEDKRFIYEKLYPTNYK